MNTSSSNPCEVEPAPIDQKNFAHDAYYGMNFSRLNDDTVLSRDSEGKVVSIFGFDTWYLPSFAYNVNDNPKFDFLPFYRDPSIGRQNVDFFKRVMILKMFGKSRRGAALRLPTLHAFRHTLLKLNRFCDESKLSAKDIFAKPEIMKRLLEQLDHYDSQKLLSLIRLLQTIGETERGFFIDGTLLKITHDSARKGRRKSQQHPIIPSRILLFKYSQYTDMLDEYLANYKNLKSIIEIAAENPNYAKQKSNYKPKKTPPSSQTVTDAEFTSFQAAVAEQSLEHLQSKYNWRAFSSVLNYVTTVSHCARNLIHLFTLMRDHEVQSLRTGCLEKVKGWNNEALYAIGITTKLYKKKQPFKWITTNAIRKPIQVLESINGLLAPYSKNNSTHLFLSVAVHPRSSARASSNSLKRGKYIESQLPPILITERDVMELESIDPLRNWRDDPKYQVGKPWTITSHQFRRSMSVFAAQSGLMTLTSLKRLLGHLAKVMSMYYSKGCSANNYYFALINPELAAEMQRAKQEADGAMFVRNALNSSEKLYGHRGREISDQINDNTWILNSRKDTEWTVANGLAAWADSPLGGCGSPNPCDKRAHGNFFTCPGCQWLIGIESTMNDTIATMRFDLAELKPGTIEYRAEQQNLEDFIELRRQVIAKG